MADGRIDFYVEAKHTPVTFVYLFKAGEHALEHGKAQPAGSAYSFMAACVFAAFSAEAYFNHVGQQRLVYWTDHIEPKLSTIAKAILLNDQLLSRTIDFGTRPYQSLREAVDYRNALAHGKTQTVQVKGVQRLRLSDEVELPKVKWQSCFDEGVACRLLEDIETIITTIHRDLGGSGHPLSDLGGGSYVKRFPPVSLGPLTDD